MKWLGEKTLRECATALPFGIEQSAFVFYLFIQFPYPVVPQTANKLSPVTAGDVKFFKV